MEEILDICELMDRLPRNNISPKELIGQTIQNLYSVKSYFMSLNTTIRNNIRATIGYIKMLYDFGQQMSLARMYLVHKIKLLEVCGNDLNAEISVLRSQSFPSGESPSFGSVINKERSQDEKEEEDEELEIILDTRMINEIDQSKYLLNNISQQIADKKKVLLDIEQ